MCVPTHMFLTSAFLLVAQVNFLTPAEKRKRRLSELAVERKVAAKRRARAFFVDAKMLNAFKVATPQQTNSVDCALYVSDGVIRSVVRRRVLHRLA